MSAQENTHIVQEAYAAFGRGDVPGILERVADDVEWESVIGSASYVPMAGVWRGRSEVGRFFKTVAANMKFETFEPREFVAQENKVVVLGHYEGTSVPTGRRFASDWVMVFTLRDGRITGFREFADSAAVNAAFAGTAASA
jgi:uncharacterized protein